jgi:uncharacterized protein
LNTHLAPPTRDFSASEFFIVILLAFGLSIAGSIADALSYTAGPIEFGDAELLSVVIYEIFFGTIILFILRSRGWQWSDFAIYYSPGATVIGIFLAAAILAAWFVLELVMGKVPSEPTASMLSVAAVSVLNPFFEEILVLGYVVQALRKRFGLTAAVNVSLTIRLLYHLYQGPLVVIPIAVFGLMVTFTYVRLGRLWPAIVAHAILDFLALSGLFD